MSKHTEIPWSYETREGHAPTSRFVIISPKGNRIAICSEEGVDEDSEENAKFIVQACNCHDEFLRLCEEIRDNGLKNYLRERLNKIIWRAKATISKEIHYISMRLVDSDYLLFDLRNVDKVILFLTKEGKTVEYPAEARDLNLLISRDPIELDEGSWEIQFKIYLNSGAFLTTPIIPYRRVE